MIQLHQRLVLVQEVRYRLDQRHSFRKNS